MTNESDHIEQSRVIARKLILAELQEAPLAMNDLVRLLHAHSVKPSQRIAKEVAWSLAEEGVAFFNDQWLLELK